MQGRPPHAQQWTTRRPASMIGPSADGPHPRGGGVSGPTAPGVTGTAVIHDRESTMGLIDWFKRGVGEMMVARPDDAKSQVVWKHPDPTIPMMSQLTVEADELAVFFRDGQVVSTLGAGRHTLDSSNIPFLSDLVDSVTGGNVFISEVFFVNVREHTGIKFGGRVGHVEDPKSGVPVECMVHGEFSFKVVDPERLIVGLVGMGRAESYQVRSWMKEQVLKVVRDRIGELLVKNKWPLLDVTSGAYTEEVEAGVLEGIGKHVQEYGIQIVRLGNFVVAIDEEDADNLKRLYTDAAYLRTVGGVGAYKEFAAGKALMGAGEGMAKGGGPGGDGAGGAAGAGMMGGAGLGVGLGLAQLLVKDHRGGETLAPAAPGVVCPACSASVSAGKFCSACGTELAAPKETAAVASGFCTSCGSTLSPDARFCGACGTKRED